MDASGGWPSVHLRGSGLTLDAATVDNLREACQPKLTLSLVSVSEGWWDQTIASWNRLTGWLRNIQALQRAV
jgi:hypothetical protein